MQIEEGAVVSGKVTGLTDFGAFVELEGGKTGMIHISEVAPNYVKDIREHLSVGQEVTSKVISITPQVWNGQKSSAPTGEKQSFEDMMARFKQVSDEKMTDLKRTDSKRGSVGYSRKGQK